MKRSAWVAAGGIFWLGVAALFMTGALPAAAQARRAQPAAAGMINGRVVDDATGEAIVDFVVQTSTPNFMSPNDVFWNHYMMGTPQTAGQFRARTPSSNEMVRILAPGYVPQVLTEQSLANQPATGLEVRLKPGAVLEGVVKMTPADRWRGRACWWRRCSGFF